MEARSLIRTSALDLAQAVGQSQRQGHSCKPALSLDNAEAHLALPHSAGRHVRLEGSEAVHRAPVEAPIVGAYAGERGERHMHAVWGFPAPACAHSCLLLQAGLELARANCPS